MRKAMKLFSPHWTCILLLSLVVRTILGAVYTTFEDLPQPEFDFVVIGGGAAGPVIANRLTENPNFSVLLLEAGPSPEGLLEYSIPLFAATLWHPGPFDWNYTLTPQAGLNGQVQAYPRGRILGGCTSMNGMAYVRGASSDYDRYARVTGDPGWSWDALQPYFRKNEQWIPPADGHNTTGQFDPRVHGFHGINSVSLYGFSIPDLDSRVTALTEERPDLFHFNLDTNSGSPIGIGWQQATIKDGKRSSSFTSYLAQQFLVRPNLHVLINAQATRVLSSNNSTVFNLVEFGSKGGPRKVVFTSKEIVISAGTLETPKLLMNSGIGDPEELLSHGTRPVVDLPDVGKNLSVHVGLGINYFVNSTDTVDDFFRNATLRNELARKWVDADGGGRLGGNYNAHPAWYRLPDDSVIFRDHPDPSSGRNAPHISGSVSNGIHSNVPPEGHFVTLDSALLTPTSRGTIQLSSSDPFDPPLIDPACLTTDFDISAIREGMKHAMAVASASVWDGYILGPLTNLSLSSTDAELEVYARAHAAPNGHIVGTASMSKKGANYGVVDPDLRVKKATGLRVVDASVLPFVPAGNTQAPVYAVAERAADLIKETWK